MTTVRLLAAVMISACLTACGGDGPINQACDEPQRYQEVQPSKKVQSPDGLDPLNEFAEMPVPGAEGAPTRPPGSPCIDLPPSIG